MGVVLLSGGLDSALNLALAAKDGHAKLAITIRYGQRAEAMECRAAQSLAQFYGIPHREVPLQWLGEINTTALTRSQNNMPQFESSELDDFEKSQSSMRAVWVANRNGVFLNITAAFAEAIGADVVFAGFNKEEASTFPDNSVAYMEALTHAFSFSTLNKVKVDSYTKNFDKREIIEKALDIGLPLNLVWSCYEAGPKRCWTCESCKRTERALLSQGNIGKEWLHKMQWN